MAIRHHPKQGCILLADFSAGFVEPEMVKKRLVVVLSPAMAARPGLCTVVALSTSPPARRMPYHAEIDIPFQIPEPWGNCPRWVKGDMVNALGFHRLDLLRLGKTPEGRRIYQKEALSAELFARVQACVLHGLGLSTLTRHLE